MSGLDPSAGPVLDEHALQIIEEHENEIADRRQKILQLLHRRMNRTQIAGALGVHPSTISRDLKDIRANFEGQFGAHPKFNSAVFTGEALAHYEDVMLTAMYDSARPNISLKDKARLLTVALMARDRMVALLQDTGQIARSQGVLTLGLPSATQVRAALAAATLPDDFAPPVQTIEMTPEEALDALTKKAS